MYSHNQGQGKRTCHTITCEHICDYLHRYSIANSTTGQILEVEDTGNRENAQGNQCTPKPNQDHEHNSTTTKVSPAEQEMNHQHTTTRDRTPTQADPSL